MHGVLLIFVHGLCSIPGPLGPLHIYKDFAGFAASLSSVLENTVRHAKMTQETQRIASSTYTLKLELDGVDALLRELGGVA